MNESEEDVAGARATADDRAGEEPSDRPGEEAIGSLRDEAARLAEALQGWAQGHGAALGWLQEHLAVDAPECRLCPVCRLIARLRDVGPEAYVHLADAASSLLLAVRAFADDGEASDRERRTGVEHSDIDEEGGWD